MTLNSNSPKKRGRPLGSKNKRYKRPAMKKSKDSTTFKQPNDGADRVLNVVKKNRELELLREHAEILLERSALKVKVTSLEHQAIGYRAVISYLEHQLVTIGNAK